MSFSRYRNDPIVRDGVLVGTSTGLRNIRRAMLDGRIAFEVVVLKEGQRLDKIAGDVYNDGRLWWIIAACSNIGWWLQVPPGTQLRIPLDLSQIAEIV